MSSDEAFEDTSNLDEILAHPMSRRAHIIRWAVLALTACIVTTFIAALSWRQIAALVNPPRTTYALHISSNVTWGTVTLTRNDHPVITTSMQGLPTFIRLTTSAATDHISVSFSAAPFTTKRCLLTLPPVQGDTCVGLNGEDVQTMGRAFVTHDAIPLDIDFPFTSDDLAPGRRGDILNLVDSILLAPPRAIIAPGSHYATGEIAGKAVMIASQPLVATLATQRFTPTDGTCAICAPITFSSPYHGAVAVWHARLNVQQIWNFTRADDGAIVGDTYENNVPHSLDFDLMYDTATQSWLSPPTSSPLLALADAVTLSLCDNGQAYLEELFFQTLPTLAQFDPHASTVDHGEDGCLFQVPAKDQSLPSATFLWRFGQMYTANEIAQHADASLPVASAPDLASFAG